MCYIKNIKYALKKNIFKNNMWFLCFQFCTYAILQCTAVHASEETDNYLDHLTRARLAIGVNIK